MNFKRTKPFLLATAGSTVDGRTIDEKMLKEMASSYDPKTYCARLNIEHVRGITGDKPFRAYGDIVSLSTDMVDVNFNGKTEKRLGLFGVFDVTEDAVALNQQGQKLYSSIEINPDFGDKGFAYCMGAAMTDSPSSIATERLQFNTTRPGALNFSRDESASLDFADENGATTAEGGNFLTSLTGVLDKFAAKFTPAKVEEKAEPKPGDATPAFSAEAFKELFGDLGKTINGAIVAQGNAFRDDVDRLSVQVNKLTKDVETTAAPGQEGRPIANGGGNFTKTAF